MNEQIFQISFTTKSRRTVVDDDESSGVCSRVANVIRIFIDFLWLFFNRIFGENYQLNFCCICYYTLPPLTIFPIIICLCSFEVSCYIQARWSNCDCRLSHNGTTVRGKETKKKHGRTSEIEKDCCRSVLLNIVFSWSPLLYGKCYQVFMSMSGDYDFISNDLKKTMTTAQSMNNTCEKSIIYRFCIDYICVLLL